MPADNTPSTSIPTPQNDYLAYRAGERNAPVPSSLTQKQSGFVPVATIIDQFGNKVQVDSLGRDERGATVIQQEGTSADLIKKPETKGTTDTVAAKEFIAPNGQKFGTQAELDAYMKLYNQNQTRAELDAAAKKELGQSAYDTLYNEFNAYGLGTLIEPLKGMIASGATGAQLSLALQNTDDYKKRFAANAQRVAKGLSALTPAQYIAMEDQYQNIMRQYGLPASYYTKDTTGKQAGFEQLLANDVSATELNDRISTAQNRVMNANPEVLQQLKVYYPDITNGDVLAYALDPKNALSALKSKVTAAEIGGAAAAAGLSDSAAQAEQLAKYGVTGAQAQQQYGTIAQLAQRGSQLADIYGQTPYGQTQAEQEIFNLGGQTAAANARRKLTELEKAQFSGSSGTSQNALNRDRASAYAGYREPGAGAF